MGALEITSRIASLDALVLSLGVEFDAAAEQAVGGDPDAGKRAAGLDEHISRLSTDRRILSRALERAETSEALKVEADAEAIRARHRADAAERVHGLVETASRIDALVTELKAALAAIGDQETAIHRALHAARVPMSNGIVGQRGIASVALARFNSMAHAAEPFRQTGKSVEATARTAWRFLLED